MSISVSAIKTAYDALGTLVTATLAAKAAIVSAGARPTYPVDVVADADYNSVTTAQATWDSANAALVVTLNTAIATQQAQELVTTNLMPPNQWVKLTTLANWGGATTQYIGTPTSKYSTSDNTSGANLYTIRTNSTLPTQAFPLV